MTNILVVDDEHSICEAFSQIFSLQDYHVKTVSNGEDAIKSLAIQIPDIIFLDNQMPGLSGIETLEQIKNIDATISVVIMTAYGSMETTMDAMRLGAFDFIQKPVELSQIREITNKILRSKSNNTVNQSPITTTESAIVGNSPAMQEIFKLMGLLTTNELTVLITGESGVGKELVSRAIHTNGERKNQPFVAVNCAAIPENLLESELFGHEKGAFTGADKQNKGKFEDAAKGTIFLDEIAELPLALQSKLLRVLQEKQFQRVGGTQLIPLQARVLAATNRNLQLEIGNGRFREDLYYRLEIIKINIPPLRERKEDIESLIHYFVDRANKDLNRNIRFVSDSALQKLQQYDWPGNIRELEHTIKRAVLISQTEFLSVENIELSDENSTVNEANLLMNFDQLKRSVQGLMENIGEDAAQSNQKSVFHRVISIVEKQMIEVALEKTGNNQVAAAKLLGLHRTTLRNKLDNIDH